MRTVRVFDEETKSIYGYRQIRRLLYHWAKLMRASYHTTHSQRFARVAFAYMLRCVIEHMCDYLQQQPTRSISRCAI